MARTLIASDAFTRANSGSLGADWTSLFPSWATADINTNQAAAADTSNEQVERWDGAGTFSDDQYAKATVTGLNFEGGNYRAGVLARASADTNANRDYYAYIVLDDGTSSRTNRLVRCVNGTQTTLATQSTAWADGNTIEIEVTTVDASTVRVTGYQNGVQSITFDDTNAARLLTGKPGVYLQGNSTRPRLDDWEGGNVTAGSSFQSAWARGSNIILGV